MNSTINIGDTVTVAPHTIIRRSTQAFHVAMPHIGYCEAVVRSFGDDGEVEVEINGILDYVPVEYCRPIKS